jgi:hypothetical protein
VDDLDEAPLPEIDADGVDRARLDAEAAHLDARGTAAFDASGEDVTLIDWMLSLSPRERLEALYASASSTARLAPPDDTD